MVSKVNNSNVNKTDVEKSPETGTASMTTIEENFAGFGGIKTGELTLRLKRNCALPDTVENIADIDPYTIYPDDKKYLGMLPKEERIFFTQSLTAYSFHCFSLAVVGCIRLLEYIVEDLIKRTEISLPKINSPKGFDVGVCKKCEYYKSNQPGLRIKIQMLQKEGITVRPETMEIVKKESIRSKHQGTSEYSPSEARCLISDTIALLKQWGDQKNK